MADTGFDGSWGFFEGTAQADLSHHFGLRMEQHGTHVHGVLAWITTNYTHDHVFDRGRREFDAEIWDGRLEVDGPRGTLVLTRDGANLVCRWAAARIEVWQPLAAAEEDSFGLPALAHAAAH